MAGDTLNQSGQHPLLYIYLVDRGCNEQGYIDQGKHRDSGCPKGCPRRGGQNCLLVHGYYPRSAPFCRYRKHCFGSDSCTNSSIRSRPSVEVSCSPEMARPHHAKRPESEASFGYDLLSCPNCGRILKLAEIWEPKRGFVWMKHWLKTQRIRKTARDALNNAKQITNRPRFPLIYLQLSIA